MESTPSRWVQEGPYTDLRPSGCYSHATIGKGKAFGFSVCANGVPSATATEDDVFTKHFLRADLGFDVVLEGKKNLAGAIPKRASANH